MQVGRWGKESDPEPSAEIAGPDFGLEYLAGHGFVGEEEGVKTGTVAGVARVCKCIASKLGGGGDRQKWVIGVMGLQLMVGYGIQGSN